MLQWSGRAGTSIALFGTWGRAASRSLPSVRYSTIITTRATTETTSARKHRELSSASRSLLPPELLEEARCVACTCGAMGVHQRAVVQSSDSSVEFLRGCGIRTRAQGDILGIGRASHTHCLRTSATKDARTDPRVVMFGLVSF